MQTSPMPKKNAGMLKAVILIGGPQKGTRFRPLSFDIPKPLFPVAGRPMMQHLVEACCGLPGVREVLLIGFYPADDADLTGFVKSASREYGLPVRYLQEYAALGTAGGIHHFRDQIRRGDPEAFLLIHGDVCGHFPLSEMLEFHRSLPKSNLVTVLATEATRQQSLSYGCIVEDKATHQGDSLDALSLEHDVLAPLAAAGRQLHVFQTNRWWSQLKTAGSAIYANRHYLELYRLEHPERLAQARPDGPTILGDVFVHPSACVDPTATLGPNVSVGPGARIGAGVRIRESLVLANATVCDHALVLHSIVGLDSSVGAWSRVEGTPCDPNPDRPFAKMENVPLFNADGRLNPSITVLGCHRFPEGTGLVLSPKKSELLLFRKARQGMRNLEPLDSLPVRLWSREGTVVPRVDSARILGCNGGAIERLGGQASNILRLISRIAILDEAGIAAPKMEVSDGVQLTRDEREDIKVDPIPCNIHPVHHAGRREARARAILRSVGSDAKAVLFVDAAEYSTRRAFGVSVVDGKGQLVARASVCTDQVTVAEEISRSGLLWRFDFAAGDTAHSEWSQTGEMGLVAAEFSPDLGLGTGCPEGPGHRGGSSSGADLGGAADWLRGS
ncbi:hypothetical protein HPB52_004287 [Rhipicephalus sanguineus]|uniref:Mannose-1-phosphate guanyltransferase n=1 Tax=Rhipicephalus sanguineus TaxID=34632 RepID=A0A9D4QGH1_RHISA|nr:hypothetical protein HPB52_004287 [Rhipicephalus sanguineus]